jgi:addiction module RelE/StbE family toxin
MVQVKWTPIALNDLKEIFKYIARDSKKYAKFQVIKLTARVKILKSYPETGKMVPEYTHPDVRELVEGNYRIIYKIVSSSQIDILTVHHSSRDLNRRNVE